MTVKVPSAAATVDVRQHYQRHVVIRHSHSDTACLRNRPGEDAIGRASVYFCVAVDSRMADAENNGNGDARLTGVVFNQLRKGKLMAHAQPPISAISSGFDK